MLYDSQYVYSFWQSRLVGDAILVGLRILRSRAEKVNSVNSVNSVISINCQECAASLESVELDTNYICSHDNL